MIKNETTILSQEDYDEFRAYHEDCNYQLHEKFPTKFDPDGRVNMSLGDAIKSCNFQDAKLEEAKKKFSVGKLLAWITLHRLGRIQGKKINPKAFRAEYQYVAYTYADLKIRGSFSYFSKVLFNNRAWDDIQKAFSKAFPHLIS